LVLPGLTGTYNLRDAHPCAIRRLSYVVLSSWQGRVAKDLGSKGALALNRS
jgi:hypothetical protein